MKGFLSAVIGLALIVGGLAMACNPDPRYEHIRSYQETIGNAAALLILFGVVFIIAGSDERS